METLVENLHNGPESMKNLWEKGVQAALVATAILPPAPAERKRPWISQRTLGLIEKRTLAQQANNKHEEKELLKEVRKS